MTRGNVILLNGCSSSGKTTLAQKLQQLLPDPYQYIALDQFRDGYPAKTRGLNAPSNTSGTTGLNVRPAAASDADQAPVTHIEVGDFGESVLAGMRRCVALFSERGINVVVDDLILQSEYLTDYVKVLNTDKTWFVAVRCDLDVVNAREAQRLGRFPGTARSHFEQVHAHGYGYDIEIDTTRTPPREVALQVIEGLGSAPSALSRGLD